MAGSAYQGSILRFRALSVLALFLCFILKLSLAASRLDRTVQLCSVHRSLRYCNWLILSSYTLRFAFGRKGFRDGCVFGGFLLDSWECIYQAQKS